MAASIELKTLMAEWFQCAVLAHGTHQVHDECQHVKETGMALLRFCGIWSTTKPMADLVTCCISAHVWQPGPRAIWFPLLMLHWRPDLINDLSAF